MPLLGICAFLADQRRSSRRFLADRGVPAKFVWLSRQTITLGLPLLLFFTLLLGCSFSRRRCCRVLCSPIILRWARLSEVYAEAYAVVYLAFGVLGYVLIGIAVGPLLLDVLPQSAAGGAVQHLLLTAIFAVWCGLMWFWQVNWLWSVLPIPLALLLATRLRAADWLLERNNLRAWLRPGLALLIPAAALLVAVPLYRVYSVPLVDPGVFAGGVRQTLDRQNRRRWISAERRSRYRRRYSTRRLCLRKGKEPVN